MTFSGFSFIITFGIIYGEILTFDYINPAPDIIECIDGSTDCVISCINRNVCRSKHMHCHRTSTNSTCTINLIADDSASFASIYTHQSLNVHINVIGWMSCRFYEIYAHEQLGSKLYIYVLGDFGMSW